MSRARKAERRARLALSLLCEPGDPRLIGPLAHLGAEGLLAAIRASRAIGGRACPTAWSHAVDEIDDRINGVRTSVETSGMRWVIPGDPGWPDGLADLDHVAPVAGAAGAPLGLWVRGSGDLAELAASSVAVVGARDCTSYGAEVAATMAADVSDGGVTVFSGAAFGIDASAHRGALAACRPTVAVLACDAASVYPRAHAALIERIAETGLIVSEQPPGQVPSKMRFLSRNRLIAALSSGTVVVEARLRSGSLNTLGWADQLGRPTMAVPGPVTSPNSNGTHHAIRDGKAVLVTSGAEVLDELGGMRVAPRFEPSVPGATLFDQLSPAEAAAVDALDWHTPCDVREVAQRASLGPDAADRALRQLADRGLVCQITEQSWLLVQRADTQTAEG